MHSTDLIIYLITPRASMTTFSPSSDDFNGINYFLRDIDAGNFKALSR
ncbi:hypothetical protein N9193_00815 [Pseudomonadales bacterium]|nr:hypothetical protein [Pseudomonadales bacterium]